MRKTFIAIAAAAVLASSGAWALQFPESCVSPPATVTRITGVNTRNARMEARYTMPDIIQACNEGYVDQANAPPALCIKRHRTLINAIRRLRSTRFGAAARRRNRLCTWWG